MKDLMFLAYNFLIPVLEGFCICRSLNLRAKGVNNIYLYIVGYGVPVLIIVGMVSATFFGQEVFTKYFGCSNLVFISPKMYLRRDPGCRVIACFLAIDAMAAMSSPATLVAVINSVFTFKIVWTIHQHRKKGKRYLQGYNIIVF